MRRDTGIDRQQIRGGFPGVEPVVAFWKNFGRFSLACSVDERLSIISLCSPRFRLGDYSRYLVHSRKV